MHHLKKQSFAAIFCCLILLCSSFRNNTAGTLTSDSKKLDSLFDEYWKQRMKLFPLESTAIGDSGYNHLLPITISNSYRDTLKTFYRNFLHRSNRLEVTLNDHDKISKELFEYELELSLESLEFPSHLMPVNQFWSFTLEFPQLGSGSGNQPFKTVQDYHNFKQRMQSFPAWVDTAIVNMRAGMQTGWVLPDVLASKVVPQLQNVVTTDVAKCIFYKPILNFPQNFSAAQKKEIEQEYRFEITNSIFPAYQKLAGFFEKEYLPACRKTHGISSLNKGNSWYQHLIKLYTTTTLTPDSIYRLGLQEVSMLKAEMEKVKNQLGFKGSLSEFFNFINTDEQFYPFKTASEVLDSFRAIQNIINPKVSELFELSPKTKFEIRQTEAYRAASASAEYNAGSEDGSRPGIFYVPILDAAKFNAVGMETLFLHEAIPGHHYQISLQQENTELPKFRKFLGYSAYAEGWALYCERLGSELGLYSNPYQYLGHLSDAMHRAIRLVVDVAIHTRNMNRDEAINYMMTNERISIEEATSEIERYMAIPGQALSYKIGQLSMSALKKKYQQKLGNKFDVRAFHTQILNGGNMPLQVLEKKLELWAKSL